ncbi:MAG TPA: LytTR family DNA-binding domain-containing protein, partial [Prolixibacteraceae bacterium]|nr:LytTR family DNA-binding domain-containing protein [Prolixibacteraceae bacterium]
DVLFLDINMPNEDGLQFAGRLREVNPSIPIVFTTAYTNYALPAFKIKPIDYLVKPFGVDEIFDVVKLIEEHIETESLNHCNTGVWGNSIPGKIKLKVNGGYVFLDCSDIVYITSSHNMVDVFLANGTKEKAYTNLNELYGELKEKNFFRINRAVIVNIDHIKRIDKKMRKCVFDFDGKEVEFPFAISIFAKFEEMKSIKLS